MTAWIGQAALIAALLSSLLQIKRSHASLAGFLFLSIAFAILMYAHAVSDFSLLNVVENSHSLKPMIYKISGVWGNHEGSMLLWVWTLALWGAVAFFALPDGHFRVYTLATQGMIGVGFLSFTILTSNPFTRIALVPTEGMDLNPLLQDIGLAIHPPLLYMGYVGFSVSFCLAMAALWDKKVDATFARHVRPFVLSAWIFLTAGITSGAVWAYYELGWGGFWFWDPVENASLMPWLVGTALLHSVSVLERRGLLGNWVIFLAILSFSLSLLGTFLVRSGLLTSVHTFATDPARGIFMLALFAVATGGAFLVYAFQAPRIAPKGGFAAISRESALLINNIFLFSFCATVLTGTLYPLVMSALNLGEVSVGPPYYTATLLPMFIPFAILMGLSPMTVWQKGLVRGAVPPLVISILLIFFLMPQKPFVLLGVGLGGWIVFATLCDIARKCRASMPLSYFGMVAAHMGFGVMVIGITATTLLGQEDITWMRPGDRMTLAGHEIAFLGAQAGEGPNYMRYTGVFTVDDDIYMTPEKRFYPVQQKTTSEVALKSLGAHVLYLTLGDQDDAAPERWTMRAYYHPLALLIVGGAAMIALGGALSLLDRRRRVTAS